MRLSIINFITHHILFPLNIAAIAKARFSFCFVKAPDSLKGQIFLRLILRQDPLYLPGVPFFHFGAFIAPFHFPVIVVYLLLSYCPKNTGSTLMI